MKTKSEQLKELIEQRDRALIGGPDESVTAILDNVPSQIEKILELNKKIRELQSK